MVATDQDRNAAELSALHQTDAAELEALGRTAAALTTEANTPVADRLTGNAKALDRVAAVLRTEVAGLPPTSSVGRMLARIADEIALLADEVDCLAVAAS